MNKIQPLSAKFGEVRFRKKLVLQHKGVKTFYQTHTTASENLKILKQRAWNSEKIFKELHKKNISLSPFLELGGEKCERAAVLTSKMGKTGAVVDLSAESLESASKFCPELNLPEIPLRICADAYHLPFSNNSIPFVFAFQTLHHFPDPEPILREIYRVLTPGGYFYFDEEPVKPGINIPLWRRDYHLRWWEKILKFTFILPFISLIGKSEVSEGVLEQVFDLKTWKRALNLFDSVEAELIPYPFGPKTKGLKPYGLSRLILSITGGGIRALCQKKGKPDSKKQHILELITCPGCQGKFKIGKRILSCLNCGRKYPIKNRIFYLLRYPLMKKLYPKILQKD